MNEKEINTSLPPGMPLLDLVRYHRHLMGTKIGCREGDCGACTVLVGELKNDELHYRSITSCLSPLGSAHGKHIVTIEGINMDGLNPVQQAMHDESATQCGFCTPGFVMSLAGFCLDRKEATSQNAIAAIDGNICRCTGYKSIERAAARVTSLLEKRSNEEPAVFAAEQKILPSYFSNIKKRLQALVVELNGELIPSNKNIQRVGGGTDLYVQKHDEMKDASIRFMMDQPELKGIIKQGSKCIIGASATVSDLQSSEILQEHFSQLQRYVKLISSTPIRNMATIAGNFVNASPIGDLTVFFLALDAMLVLNDGKTTRELPLTKFYKGYKSLDKKPEEYIEKIWFELPAKQTHFHFEKVSKRTHLDIASVNTAIQLSMETDVITKAKLSAGGVGPIPAFLKKTSNFLEGKILSEDLVHEAIEISQTEITPISDARGAEVYKRLLLSQLIKAHFITLFPALRTEKING